jgi:hypothetical protein
MFEINPVLKTSDDKIIAVDSKVTLDANALYRHKEYAAMRDKELEMRECNHKCNQGRDCTCATCYSNWSAKVVIYIFLITAIVFIVL